MSAQQLLLSWKDHNGALVAVFENLLKKNTLVDCTLAAEGQYLKAHKVVLSACSSYFELLFSQESEKNPIVILKDVKFQELEAAVNFMYRGEVEVCEDRLAAFLEVADSLQIKGLGSEGKSQDSKEKNSPVKTSSAKSALTQRQQSRKEDLNLRSDTAGQRSYVPVDCEQIRNESSSVHQSSRRESSPSHALSTYSVGSSSCAVRKETHRDSDCLENIQQSLVLPSFTSGESVQSQENSIIKIEPETDTFIEDQSDEAERDYGDEVTMMDDQDDWDEPNSETMDVMPTSQPDIGYTSEHVKTEDSTSENVDSMEPGNQSTSEGAGGIESERAGSPPVLELETPLPPSASPEVGHLSPQTVHPCKRRSCSPCAGVQPPSKVFTSPKPKRVPAARLPLPVEEKTFKCLMCPSAFPSAHLLREHYATHTESRPFQCPDCAYAAMQMSDLRKHQRIHTGERPYTCRECGMSFTQSNSLKIHERIHTGDRPFKCADCDKAFTVKGHLVAHRRKCHDGEGPYVG